LTATQQDLATANQKVQNLTPTLYGTVVPKNPYPPGKIFTRKYTRDEATTMIAALRELTAFATKAMPPLEKASIIFQIGKYSPWPSEVASIEVDGAIQKLHTMSNSIDADIKELNNILAKYPAYKDDIERMIGSPGLEDLRSMVNDRYIATLAGLQHASGVDLGCLLRDPVEAVWRSYNNVRNWSQSFIQTRAPEADKELRGYL
jgi:hypothetical protein